MISLEEYISRFKYIPVICGPTASGKSDMAMKLCEACGGELVSCDSMQIYRGLNIGTAKPTKEEMGPDYGRLSEEERKSHIDLECALMQGSQGVVLMAERLLSHEPPYAVTPDGKM